MPLMTRIRESLSTFFSVFAGLFVVYIVLDWGMDITGRRHSDRLSQAQEVGKINGKAILAKDFSEMVRRATENQKTQTGSEPDENDVKQIREQVWNQLVDQTLYDEQTSRLGITVPDQEIVQWVRSDDPPPFMKQQFTDSTGTFNRQAYDMAIMDPKNRAVMVQVEAGLRKQREREKLQSIIMASVQVGESEIRQRFTDQNAKFTVDYILFDPNTFIKDDQIKVADDDLRKFYNDHSEEFRVEASRKVKYVQFTESPSHGDSTSVLEALDDISKRLKQGADFVVVAKQESETPILDSAYHSRGESSPARDNRIFSAKAGDIIGPLTEEDGYHLIKVLEFKEGNADIVHASHVLIAIENNDSVKALKKAKEIVAEAKSGKDFAELARKNSTDQGSAAQGGELGWFGKGKMVKAFEEAALKAKPGQIVGPVRSPFGYHIIKVTEKDRRQVRIADLHISVHVSPQTRNEISQRAQDFSYLAKQGAFDKEAEQSKYGVRETPSFSKGGVIPGIGTNAAISKFAFSGKMGSVSDAIALQDGYGVFIITEVIEAGIRPFDDAKAGIEPRVKREKKTEKTIAEAEKIRQTLGQGDNLSKAVASHPGIAVQHAPDITLSGFVPGVGRDMGFIGGVSALHPGEISKPIDGGRGIFLINLISSTPFDSAAYSAQRETIRTQLLTEKRNRFFSEWTDHLKKSAEIVDNRENLNR